jgi:hypothetical protein
VHPENDTQSSLSTRNQDYTLRYPSKHNLVDDF